MPRRSLILFVILNVIISVGVALAVIQLANSRGSSSTSLTQVITVEVVYTSTPGPTQTPFIVTATPREGTVILPPDLLGSPAAPENNTGGSAQNVNPVATIDPAALAGAGGDPTLLGTALPENCILHTIVEGDSPFAIAEEYGADGFQLLQVNGLTEETSVFLQIGQVLIVPLEGCPLTQDLFGETTGDSSAEPEVTEAPPTAEQPATSTGAPTVTPSPSATATLPPTAENAQMQIVGIRNPGVITQEYIEILNTGNTVSILNWVIRDGQGNEYRFAEQLLFSRGSIRVYTGSGGTDTPNVKYWGLPSAVWLSGDTATLLDSDGQVQAVFSVP